MLPLPLECVPSSPEESKVSLIHGTFKVKEQEHGIISNNHPAGSPKVFSLLCGLHQTLDSSEPLLLYLANEADLTGVTQSAETFQISPFLVSTASPLSSVTVS